MKDKVDYQKTIINFGYIFTIELQNVKETLNDEFQILVMQEELEQFERNNVWELISRLEFVNVIGTRWILKNKSVARLESIRLLLQISCFMKFKLHKMDVKSAFLNGFLNEEVYIEQLKIFVHPTKPSHVFKLRKALYGLKQTPRGWYERRTEFLLNNSYTEEVLTKPYL